MRVGKKDAHHEHCDVSLFDISPDTMEAPILGKLVMKGRLLPVASATDTLAPCDERSSRVIRVAVAVVTDSTHSVVRGEDKGRLAVIMIEVSQELDGFRDNVVDNADVTVVFRPMGTVRVTRSIKTEKMFKEHHSWLAKLGVQERIRTGVVKELPKLVEYPQIEIHRVGCEILRLFVVAERLHTLRVTRAQLEHGQNVRRAERKGVGGLVENRIKRYRILSMKARDGSASSR